jgi:hypothetical protein
LNIGNVVQMWKWMAMSLQLLGHAFTVTDYAFTLVRYTWTLEVAWSLCEREKGEFQAHA